MTFYEQKPMLPGVTQSCCDFSSIFHKTVARWSENNVVDSPFSVHILLSCLFHGCDGLTAKEMLTGLKLGDTQRLRFEYEKVIETINSILHVDRPKQSVNVRVMPIPREDINRPIVTVANGIFLQEGIPLQESFAITSKDFFECTIENVNFKDSFGSANSINSWVCQKTKGIMKDVLNSGSIHPDTKLTLVNTIYMKARWEEPFSSLITKNLVFHVTETLDKEVATMVQTCYHYCGRIPKWKSRFLIKPYEDGEFDMLIILPEEIEGLKFVEEHFDWNLVVKATKILKETCLYLPKFKIESEINLGAVLQEMGMKSMFEARGDFGRISPVKLKPPLKVDEVVQKAVLEVNEMGTVASAVTLMVLRGGGGSMSSPPPPPIEFIVDRPFMIVIRHKSSNIPLFISSIRDIGENPRMHPADLPKRKRRVSTRPMAKEMKAELN